MSNRYFYAVGGTVQASDALYIRREADDRLLELCRQGKFAYILAPRQIGKSSLMVNTAQRLRQDGVLTATVDLTRFGTQLSAEQWYLGILFDIAESLNIETDPLEWWQAHNHLGDSQRLTRFFEQVLAAETVQPIVIFVDEIDITLSLRFADNFFSAIRYFYNARANHPQFSRFSFVLLGVANPAELVHDQKLTPFNLGQAVKLDDFTLEQCLPLADGLDLPTPLAHQVLKAVFRWTHGHPYLTQRACQAICEKRQNHWSGSDVDLIIKQTFLLDSDHRNDNNLVFVNSMLTRKHSFSSELLETYRRILQKKRPVYDDERSLVKAHLKLSGVVRDEDSILVVRNLIYRSVFDAAWVKKHIPINWRRRFLLLIFGMLIVLLLGALLYYVLPR